MQKQNNSIRNVKLRKKGIRFATEEMNKLSRMWIKRKRKRKTGREGEREGGREGGRETDRQTDREGGREGGKESLPTSWVRHSKGKLFKRIMSKLVQA